MSYQALYRKYRPATFDAVVGQDHITTILKNQVQSGHIAHAYLFSGTRGTGKTTTARIFARAINCLDPQNGEPCGKCAACLVSASENADIIELDAASNSSVDDIRSLVEKARYTPLQLKIKVYIIDEAHALASSSQAFNALLKTLEEPPAHVVFILATTEPQKLPATIRSRCQRLDFHRLRVADMTALLRDVLQKSGASIEEDGLLSIARAADGGMRDALSLADQCLAFCGNTVSAQDVYRVLGSMDSDFLYRMADACAAGDAATALTLLDQVIRDGRDLTVFTQDMAQHMRALLLTKVCGESAELLDCTPDNARRYKEQSAACGEAWLLYALEQLSAVQAELKWLTTPRARIESMLVRIARPDQARAIDDLTARMDALEQRIQKGLPASPPPASQTSPRQTPDSEPDDAPPWDDAPVSQAQISSAPAPAKPDAAPQKAAIPKPSADRWAAALEALKKTDMMLFAMVRNAAAEIEKDRVLLRFEKEIYVDAVKKNREKLEALLGCPIAVELGGLDTKETPEARARALFGDALKITD